MQNTEPIDLDAERAERDAFEAERRGLEDEAHRAREEAASTWAEVDLGKVLDGDLEPEQPTILRRTDGRALLYPGKTHSFVGEFESGKTWAAVFASAEMLLADRHVLYVDFEDSAKTFVRWLRQLGIPAATVRKFAHYIRPSKPLTTAKGPVAAAQRAFYAVGARHQPDLVVLDGVTEVMALHGLNPNEGPDVARFLDLMPRRWDQTGAAVILIDHVVKSKDERGRYAIGSQHKMAGINGASYKFELDGELSPGRHGEVAITVMKDREGAIREFAKDGRAVGTMHLRPAPDRGPRDLDITIEAASDEWVPSASLLEAVLGELRKAPASQSAIANAIVRSGDDVGKTLNWLLIRGRVDGGTRKQWLLLETEPDPDRFDGLDLTGPQPDPAD